LAVVKEFFAKGDIISSVISADAEGDTDQGWRRCVAWALLNRKFDANIAPRPF
jgi:hypothetical protein